MLLWMFLPRDAWESQQGCSSPSLSGEGWGWEGWEGREWEYTLTDQLRAQR